MQRGCTAVCWLERRRHRDKNKTLDNVNNLSLLYANQGCLEDAEDVQPHAAFEKVV